MQRSYAPNTGLPNHRYGGEKYGPVEFGSYYETDPYEIRERARGVYRESTIAHGIVTRFVDTVINTGLTWESSPMWSLIPGGPRDEDARYETTREIELLWNLYSNSREADVAGRLTLSQLERVAWRTGFVDGELTAIVRYLNAEDRTSPVALQLLNADQIRTPWGTPQMVETERRGGEIKDGIEYDSAGREVAIWVQEDWDKDHVRIPYFGPRSGRRFVIRYANTETAGQNRGFPELDALVYELSRLTEYDIAELEAAVASAAMIAAVETDKDAPADPGKVKFKPNVPQQTSDAERYYGMETRDLGRFALIMNNLEPGQRMQFFQQQRPNQNFPAFIEHFSTRLAGSLGMPLSVLQQKFQSSYSAARAEKLFYELNVNRRRDDFIHGFMEPLYEAWFTEHVRAGNIEAAGYFRSKKARHAWLHGAWSGARIPSIDPVKEVTAIEKRLNLGHTTGEREAKRYNGSDYRENVDRLAKENDMLSEARPQEGGDE
jgi:lambda family phage portal protein